MECGVWSEEDGRRKIENGRMDIKKSKYYKYYKYYKTNPNIKYYKFGLIFEIGTAVTQPSMPIG